MSNLEDGEEGEEDPQYVHRRGEILRLGVALGGIGVETGSYTVPYTYMCIRFRIWFRIREL